MTFNVSPSEHYPFLSTITSLGGADDETSLVHNETVFSQFSLVPRYCQGLDLGAVDLSTTVLGEKLEWPVICSPWGLQTLIHRDGEVGMARTVHQTGSAYVLSAASEVTLEALAHAVTGPCCLAGKIMADLALDRDDQWGDMCLVRPPTQDLPPEPFRSVGVRWVRKAIARTDDDAHAGRKSGLATRTLAGMMRGGLVSHSDE